MYILEYSTCKRIDGIEEWEDCEAHCDTIEQVEISRNTLRAYHSNNFIVFGDIIEKKGNVS